MEENLDTIDELKRENEEMGRKIKEYEEHVKELKQNIEDKMKEYDIQVNNLQNKRKKDLGVIDGLNKKLFGSGN
jgi:predicted  nucleic acid-binding Zn-ribbon protein